MRIIALAAAALIVATPALATTTAAYGELLTQAIGSRDAGGSVAKANEAIRLDPALAEAYVIKGIGLIDLSRFTEAEQALQMGIERKPDWARAWMLLGHARYSDGRPQPAIEAFLRADKLQPNDAFVLRGLGESYLELENWGEARRSFEAALKADRKDVASQTGLGRALMGDGQYRKAANAFRAALEAGGDSEDASIGLILSLDKAGDKAGARRALAEYGRKDPAAAELVGRSIGL